MDVSFEREAQKDEWLTPPHILDALGEFDLDPCSPIGRPWDTAKKHYTVLDEGLHKEWEGRVFCNPPYGKENAEYLKNIKIAGCYVDLSDRVMTKKSA